VGENSKISWTEQTIDVPMVGGVKTIEAHIKAWVAVHRAILRSDLWVLTHLPSGGLMVSATGDFASLGDAKRAAEIVLEIAPECERYGARTPQSEMFASVIKIRAAITQEFGGLSRVVLGGPLIASMVH